MNPITRTPVPNPVRSFDTAGMAEAVKADTPALGPSGEPNYVETGDSCNSPTTLPPAPPFPVDALPPAPANYVNEGAEAIGCPPDYIALPLLAALSAAIGTTVLLVIKSDWHERASLFTAVVAPSGAKKTPAMTYALQFAHERAIALDVRHQQDLESHNRLMAKYQQALNACRRSRDRSAASDMPTKPNRPAAGRVTIGDTTVEALGKRLKENPRGLLMERDEMAGWLLGLNQYRGGRGNDLQNYLSIWSNSLTTIDRKSEEDPVILHCPFLSICGGIQPALLPKILGKERLDDGCTARLLFADPEPVPLRPSEATVQEETIERMRRVFDALYHLSHADPKSTPPKPHLVRLSRAARELLIEWEAAMGARVNSMSSEDPFRAPISKMPGYLGRLALVLHIVKWTERLTETIDEIDEPTMREAIRLANYFVAHAERVWRRLIESPEDTAMRRVRAWMEKRGHAVTLREIQQAGVGGFRRALEVKAALDRMVECGWVVPITVGQAIRYALTKEDSRAGDV